MAGFSTLHTAGQRPPLGNWLCNCGNVNCVTGIWEGSTTGNGGLWARIPGGDFGSKVLYTNLYALYEGDYTMAELLQRQKATIARNIAANGG